MEFTIFSIRARSTLPICPWKDLRSQLEQALAAKGYFHPADAQGAIRQPAKVSLIPAVGSARA